MEEGMEVKIIRWEDDLVVPLPEVVLAQAKLDVSSPIDIYVKGGAIVIKAADGAPVDEPEEPSTPE